MQYDAQSISCFDMLKDTWILDGNMNITNLMSNELTSLHHSYFPSQQNTICVSTFKDLSITSTDSYKVTDTQNSYFEFNACSLKRNFATLLTLNSFFQNQQLWNFFTQLIVHLILIIYTLLMFWISQKYKLVII